MIERGETRKRSTPARAGRLKAVLALALAFAPPAVPVRAQVADCVLAEVNRLPVTLSDIRILQAFDLPSLDRPGEAPLGPRALLDRVIDEDVVIQSTQGETAVPAEDLTAAMAEVRAGLSAGEFESRLGRFGLGPEDLVPYLQKELLFREVIDRRFGRSVPVTLAEIEAYYDQTYVPDRKEAGLEPEPLTRVLEEIETAIRSAKVSAQVRTWIDSLRREAEIVFKDDCLKILEEKTP